MYDYEIDNIMQSKNYRIDSETYFNIFSASPQVKNVKYSPYSDYFEAWSKDRYWKFSVYRKEN